MKYCAYKLQFTTPVHFGGGSALSLESAQMCFCADTLFSALCHTAQLRSGNIAVERLCRAVSDGVLVFSDGMPWRKRGDRDVFYLPRPILSPMKRMELPPEDRKAMKKLRYLPIDAMDAYLDALTGGKSVKLEDASPRFGSAEEIVRACVPEQGDTVPYFVGAYRFDRDAGLYFLVGSEESELQAEILRLVKLLQYSGIGGKISSGYGKFELADVIDLDASDEEYAKWLLRALSDRDAPIQMSLAICLPADDELETALEGAEYQLMRRGGFINEPLPVNSSIKNAVSMFSKRAQPFARAFRDSSAALAKPQGIGCIAAIARCGWG